MPLQLNKEEVARDRTVKAKWRKFDMAAIRETSLGIRLLAEQLVVCLVPDHRPENSFKCFERMEKNVKEMKQLLGL